MTSADELLDLPLEEKALSALSAGLRLPRARDATDESLTRLLEPLLDEAVRRELRIHRALEGGERERAAVLITGSSRRGRLLSALRDAVEGERYSEAAELSLKLSTETARRMDVTQVSSNNIKLIMIKLSTETARRMDVTQVSSLRSRHSFSAMPLRTPPTCIQEGADDTYLDRTCIRTCMHTGGRLRHIPRPGHTYVR